MFGGFGIYRDGLIFGLVASDVLYLKADTQNRGEYEAVGSEPFSYTARRKQVILSYWRAPEEALESRAAMRNWARSAYAAALRAKAGSPHGEDPEAPAAHVAPTLNLRVPRRR